MKHAHIHPLISAGCPLVSLLIGVSLMALIPELGALTRHEDARVRSDACHYLSLTHDVSVRKYIEPLLRDDHEEVREVAEESLQRRVLRMRAADEPGRASADSQALRR